MSSDAPLTSERVARPGTLPALRARHIIQGCALAPLAGFIATSLVAMVYGRIAFGPQGAAGVAVAFFFGAPFAYPPALAAVPIFFALRRFGLLRRDLVLLTGAVLGYLTSYVYQLHDGVFVPPITAIGGFVAAWVWWNTVIAGQDAKASPS